MKALSAISAAASLLLSECGKQFDERPIGSDSSPELLLKRATAPKVVWFFGSPDALERTWKLCRSAPGDHRAKPACVKTGQAHVRVLMLGRERALSSSKQ